MNNNGAIIRAIVLAVALFNQILVTAGYSPLPFDDATVEMVISGAFTGVAMLIAWWKNNSISKEAQEADEYLMELKENKRASK